MDRTDDGGDPPRLLGRRSIAALSAALSLALAAILAGRQRTSRDSWRLVQTLLGRASNPDRRVAAADFEDCPAPVRRYFETVLEPGRPHVARVRVEQRGQFRLGDADSAWKPLRATQRFTVDPPGLVWDATVRIAPFLPVRVTDWFVDGRGGLRARLLSAVTVAQAGPSPELDEGELLRYLAEAVWFPTALLPAAGVEWAGIDERTARATLVHEGTRASLVFHFDEAGYVTRVTGDRYRMTDDGGEQTPWVGEFDDYESRNGTVVPTTASVAWVLPTGRLEYFRGELAAVEHWPSGGGEG